MNIAREFCEYHCQMSGRECLLKRPDYNCPVDLFVDYLIKNMILNKGATK